MKETRLKGAPWLVAGGTVAGLVAVLSYHTQQMPAVALSNSASNGGAPAAQGTPTAPSGTASKASTTQAGPTGSGTKSAQGPTENFGYGELAVKVTVQNGRITKISVPVLRTAEPTSQQISEEAIPTLTSEIMSAQSLKVNAISGATYTSEAYGQSIQAALDKLHFK